MMHYIAGIYYSDKNLMEQAHEIIIRLLSILIAMK